MAIRNIIVPRTSNQAVSSQVTLRIVGNGANPLLAGDCVGDVLPVIVISFGANDTSKTVPIPVKSGTAIGKGFRATLTDPVPAATLPAAITETVGYDGSSAGAAFFADPVFAEPMFA